MDVRMVKLLNEYFLIDKAMLFSCQEIYVRVIVARMIKNPAEIHQGVQIDGISKMFKLT